MVAMLLERMITSFITHYPGEEATPDKLDRSGRVSEWATVEIPLRTRIGKHSPTYHMTNRFLDEQLGIMRDRFQASHCKLKAKSAESNSCTQTL